MTKVAEDFLLKIKDCNKFVTLADDIDNFINNENSSNYIIIRPVNSDEFQLEVTKKMGDEGIEYIFNPVVVTKDESEFTLQLNLKTEQQLHKLIELTSNALKKHSNLKKYAKILNDLL